MNREILSMQLFFLGTMMSTLYAGFCMDVVDVNDAASAVAGSSNNSSSDQSTEGSSK